MELTLTRDELPSEAHCRDFLFRLRYPDDTPCPKCGGDTKFYRLRNRKSYTCEKCGWHVSPTAGTPLDKTRVPLHDWLWVALLMIDHPKITSDAIATEIDVSYKTAWRMRREIARMFGYAWLT